MKQAENPKNHIGIPTHRSGPKILFLMFADDCIIFAKASQNACNNDYIFYLTVDFEYLT